MPIESGVLYNISIFFTINNYNDKNCFNVKWIKLRTKLKRMILKCLITITIKFNNNMLLSLLLQFASNDTYEWKKTKQLKAFPFLKYFCQAFKNSSLKFIQANWILICFTDLLDLFTLTTIECPLIVQLVSFFWKKIFLFFVPLYITKTMLLLLFVHT